MSNESLIFYDLIENRLNIDTASFEEAERLEAIEMLIYAANAMQGKVGDFTGINICIHVASVVVLLGCKEKGQYRMVENILKTKFKGVDPSVIITSAALYYSLRRIIGKLNSDKHKEIEDQYINYLQEKTKNDGTTFDKIKSRSEIEGATIKLEYIIDRFDRMNWMIGVDAMEALGIPKKGSEKTWIFQEQSPTDQGSWVLKSK